MKEIICDHEIETTASKKKTQGSGRLSRFLGFKTFIPKSAMSRGTKLSFLTVPRLIADFGLLFLLSSRASLSFFGLGAT